MLDWTLSDPGQRIATMLVYVRFRDADGTLLCGSGNLLDDIIYDPLPPAVQVEVVQPELNAAGTSPAAVTDEIGIRLTATDQPDGSGVTAMQIGTTNDFVDVPWQPFTEVVQVDVPRHNLCPRA